MRTIAAMAKKRENDPTAESSDIKMMKGPGGAKKGDQGHEVKAELATI